MIFDWDAKYDTATMTNCDYCGSGPVCVDFGGDYHIRCYGCGYAIGCNRYEKYVTLHNIRIYRHKNDSVAIRIHRDRYWLWTPGSTGGYTMGSLIDKPIDVLEFVGNMKRYIQKVLILS